MVHEIGVFGNRTSEDHNRSIFLNNLNKDDDSDGISETEVGQNNEEDPLNDDHWEVVKKDEFDSFSHVSLTYEEAARKANETKKTRKVKLKENDKKRPVFGKSLFAQDLQPISKYSFSGLTKKIKDEVRRALGLVRNEVHEEVAKEKES
nr:hypothetical protein [Tanacetum cinerariifolium]